MAQWRSVTMQKCPHFPKTSSHGRKFYTGPYKYRRTGLTHTHRNIFGRKQLLLLLDKRQHTGSCTGWDGDDIIRRQSSLSLTHTQHTHTLAHAYTQSTVLRVLSVVTIPTLNEFSGDEVQLSGPTAPPAVIVMNMLPWTIVHLLTYWRFNKW